MASGASSGGAGDGEKSMRKRITAQIKRALTIKSGKSKRSSVVSDTTATGGPSSPTSTTPAPIPDVPAAVPAAVPAVVPAVPDVPATATVPAPTPPARARARAPVARPIERAGPASPPQGIEQAWAMARTPRARRLAAPPVLSPAERALVLFRRHGMEFGPVDWPLFRIPPSERVPKDIRMRVHRTCHKCSLTFGADRVCTGCSHKRCKRCPKYPVKKAKDKGKGKEKAGETTTRKKKLHYDPNITIPDRHGGQPRVRKLARQRVHRICHRCKTDFAGEKLCRNCSHTRCRTCPHEPYKKNKPQGYYDRLDPEDSEKEEPLLPLRLRRTFKKPRRRVRWTCGTCDTTFVERTKICEGCGSSRDVTGIRDPPKRQRSPADEDTYRMQQRFRQVSLTAQAAGRAFYLSLPRRAPP